MLININMFIYLNLLVLQLTIDPTDKGWDFGTKPITFEKDNRQRN